MEFCQNCGAQLKEGTKFCPNCGTLVQSQGSPAAVQPEAASAAAAMPAEHPASAPVAVMEKEPASPAAPQPGIYQQPAPQPGAYQQPAPQPGAYQQPAPQPGAYQQPAPQPGAYQQPAPQPGVYQQPAHQPGVYQQAAPQPGVYQQTGPQPGVYQQPYGQQPIPPVQPGYQQQTSGNGQMRKGMAILSYFGILVLIPIFAAKNDPFARFHANQGLVLFVIMAVCNIIANVLNGFLIEISPILVLAVSAIFGIITLALCIFALIGIIRAIKGQTKPLPLIGGIKILK